VIQKQVHRGPRDDGRELLQEFDGLEEEVRRSIAPHRLELDEDASIGAEAYAVLGERGAEEIATELLEAGAIVWGDPDVGKLLGDTAAVAALLDRLLHHAHVLTCGPRSWRTRLHSDRNAS
jgi:hypothetical protein